MSEHQKFSKAIRKGDSQKVGQILQSPNFSINQLDAKSGKTFLQLSMENEEYQIFQMLISQKDIDLSKKSKEGQSCIQTAITMNSLIYVNALLLKKFNLAQKNSKGQSVLQIAIQNQISPEIIKRLIQYGCDINQKIPQYGSLLHICIIRNLFQNFQLLLAQENVQIRNIDDYGNNILMEAAKQKRGDFVMAIFQILQTNVLTQIEKQFFINCQNEDGNTALHLAVINDYQTITDIIIRQGSKYGLDKYLRNKSGKTYTQIIEDRNQAKIREQKSEAKRKQERYIKQKQKQQEKLRRIREQQRMRVQEKRRKKQEQAKMQQQRIRKSQQEKGKTIWICGIGFIIVLCLMYLLILNAIPKPSSDSF